MTASCTWGDPETIRWNTHADDDTLFYEGGSVCFPHKFHFGVFLFRWEQKLLGKIHLYERCWLNREKNANGGKTNPLFFALLLEKSSCSCSGIELLIFHVFNMLKQFSRIHMYIETQCIFNQRWCYSLIWSGGMTWAPDQLHFMLNDRCFDVFCVFRICIAWLYGQLIVLLLLHSIKTSK